MHSKQELIETAVLNHLMRNKITDRKAIQEDLVSLGLVKPSTSSRLNTIKMLCCNLQNRFKKVGIPLFEVSAVIAFNYEITFASLEYCKEFLWTPLYDEEGTLVGDLFQHPIVLNEERERLI